MTLPADAYRDPLMVLLAKEENGCKACIFEATVIDDDGERKTICARGNRYGQRCSSYDDGSDR